MGNHSIFWSGLIMVQTIFISVGATAAVVGMAIYILSLINKQKT